MNTAIQPPDPPEAADEDRRDGEKSRRRRNINKGPSEAVTRKNRRAQRNTQQKKWRDRPGLCWPSPQREGDES